MTIVDQTRKLERLITKSQKTLLEVTTVFPFDFFPDRVRIDEIKVDIISFEFSSHTTHILQSLNVIVLQPYNL